MKKVLLILFVLAILLLAFPQGVMAVDTASGSATVSANILSYITLDVNTPTAWDLSFEANQCGNSVNACNQKDDAISGTVHSSDDWTLATKPHATGKMTAGGTALQNYLLIENTGGTLYDDLVAAKSLASGAGGTTVGDTFANNLRQTLDIRDRSDIGAYSITIQLEATTAA